MAEGALDLAGLQTEEPPRSPIHPLDRDEIRSIVQAEIHDAVGALGSGSEISNQRAQALRDYYGEPFGNEQAGYSQVVLRDLADTVEWMLPSLLRIFFGGRYVGIYLPTTPEEVAFADQATEHVNDIFQDENGGFLLFHNWFKDALLEKNGFTKGWYEKVEIPRYQVFDALGDEELMMLLQQMPQGAEPVAFDAKIEAVEGQEPRAEYSITVKTKETIGRLRSEGIAPEDFLVSRRAVSLETASFAAHRKLVTLSELVEMGFPVAQLDKLAAGDGPEWTEERMARHNDDETLPSTHHVRSDWASRPVWLYECILRIDEDGDGYAELRKITVAGENAMEILDDEPIEESPFCDLTPIPMPHKLFGRSVADLVTDLQYIRSTVLRQLLDNFYLQNHGRYEVVEDMVNLDDLVTIRPGGWVRTKEPGMLKAMEVPALGPIAFNLLEALKEMVENRTGITRYTQGMDSDSLNKTASGVNSILNAAQMRIELIARIFAETGVKQLFGKMLRLLVRHERTVKTVRIRGDWQPIAPMQWNPAMKVKVDVGIGTGQTPERVAYTQQLFGMQMQLLQSPLAYMVSGQNVYNTVTKLTEQMGYRIPELYWTDPQGQPPPQPPPDPRQVQAEAETEKIRADIAREQAETELKDKQIQSQLEMERMRTETYGGVERERIASQERIQREQLQIQRGKLAVDEFAAESKASADLRRSQPFTAQNPPRGE